MEESEKPEVIILVGADRLTSEQVAYHRRAHGGKNKKVVFEAVETRDFEELKKLAAKRKAKAIIFPEGSRRYFKVVERS